jgi:hypothetical protein
MSTSRRLVGKGVDGKKSLDHTLALLAGLAGFALYARTLAPSVLISDAGEYQFVLPQLGIAHPTGYPLYTMLGHLWSRLPLGSPAYRTNLLSAVCGALALSLLYLTFRQVTERRPLALLSALFLGATPTYWSQMVVAGSYAPNALIFVALVYFGLQCLEGRKGLGPVMLLYGIGLAHHRTTILATPAIAYLVWLERRSQWSKQRVARLATLVLVPNLSWLYIPIRAHQLGRQDLDTLGKLLEFVSGKTFSYYLFMGGWARLSKEVSSWWALMRGDLGWPTMVVALGGLVLLLRSRRRVGVFTLLIYLAHLGFNLSYRIGNIHMYYIPSYVLLLLWATVCVEQSLGWIERRMRSRPCLRTVGVQGVVAGLFCMTLIRVAMLYPSMDMSRDRSVEDFWLDALSAPLVPGSTVFTDWNMHTPLVYYQRVEERRRDLRPAIVSKEAVAQALDRGETVYAVDLPPVKSVALSTMGPLIELRAQPRTGADVSIAHPADVGYGECLRLHGYDVARLRRDASGALRYLVTLYWSSSGGGACDLGITVRLYANERLLAQTDSRPVRGLYPLERWRPDEVVIDTYVLRLPADCALPLQADLVVAAYQSSTLEPLVVEEGGESLVRLGPVQLSSDGLK